MLAGTAPGASQQARTELKRVNRELKQLRAQVSALEERRAALIAELAEQG
jgi:transposase